MKLGRFFAATFLLLENWRTRLPKFVFDLIHRAIPSLNVHRTKSVYHCKNGTLQLYASDYTDRMTFPCGNNQLSIELNFNLPPKTTILSDVFCLADGKVISNAKVSQHSSLSGRTSFYGFCKAAHEFLDLSPGADCIPEAWFLPRQFIDHFSWGDYVLETLYPLAWIYKKINAPIIVDNDKVFQYLSNDAGNLAIKVVRIPITGLWVNRLHVVGGCQVYDNFCYKNIIKFKHFYSKIYPPLSPPPTFSETCDRVYLSRLGLENVNPRNPRKINNENELEDRLRTLGFKIIHPHKNTNQEIISAMKGARTVIGPWGSAFLHLAFSKPKNIIEIAHTGCWGPACLKMGVAMGVVNYHVYQIDNNEMPIEHFIQKVSDFLK